MQTTDLHSAMIKEQVEEYSLGYCKSRRTRNVEGIVKKKPQRGLGVAQLEMLRFQEEKEQKQNDFHFPKYPKLPLTVSSYPLVLQKWPPNPIVLICHGDPLNGNYSKFCPQSSGSFLPPTSEVLIRSPPFVASKQTRVESEVSMAAFRKRNHVYPTSSACKNGVQLVQKLPSSPPKGIMNKTSVLEPVKDTSQLLNMSNDSNFTGGSSEELSSFQNYPPNTPWRRAEKTSQSVRKRSWNAVSENPSTESPSSLALGLSVAGHEDGRLLRNKIQDSSTSAMESTNNQLHNLNRHIVYSPYCAQSYPNGEDVGALMQKDFLSLRLASSFFSDNCKAQKTKNTFHDNHETGNLKLDLSL